MQRSWANLREVRQAMPRQPAEVALASRWVPVAAVCRTRGMADLAWPTVWFIRFPSAGPVRPRGRRARGRRGLQRRLCPCYPLSGPSCAALAAVRRTAAAVRPCAIPAALIRRPGLGNWITSSTAGSRPGHAGQPAGHAGSTAPRRPARKRRTGPGRTGGGPGPSGPGNSRASGETLALGEVVGEVAVDVGLQAGVADDQPELPVVVERGVGEVLRADEDLRARGAVVGHDDLAVDVEAGRGTEVADLHPGVVQLLVLAVVLAVLVLPDDLHLHPALGRADQVAGDRGVVHLLGVDPDAALGPVDQGGQLGL